MEIEYKQELMKWTEKVSDRIMGPYKSAKAAKIGSATGISKQID